MSCTLFSWCIMHFNMHSLRNTKIKWNIATLNLHNVFVMHLAVILFHNATCTMTPCTSLHTHRKPPNLTPCNSITPRKHAKPYPLSPTLGTPVTTMHLPPTPCNYRHTPPPSYHHAPLQHHTSTTPLTYKRTFHAATMLLTNHAKSTKLVPHFPHATTSTHHIAIFLHHAAISMALSHSLHNYTNRLFSQ